jgi:hypothetical protein
VCSRNASRAPWRKAPERTRWNMDSVCEGGAVCACSDRTDATLSTASDGARASRGARGVHVLLATVL